MPFPEERPRRMRRTPALRALARETRLAPSQLIAPLFVREGLRGDAEIPSLPGQRHLGPDGLLRQAEALARAGVGGVLLFGIPKRKDAKGAGAWNPQGVVPKAIKALKREFPQLVAIADTCLCEYTTHGHCGPLRRGRHGGLEVDNDAALESLARVAVAQARAGADLVAPSDMMDGRVGRLRQALDDAKAEDVGILSYAVKQASCFYGPFREAAGSAPSQGDRKGYQMDPANGREALREAALDEEEGADILMVKPGGPCLDLIAAVRAQSLLPVAAYQVSGEYAALHAAAGHGWLDLAAARDETLTAMVRAGADMIATYFALDAATAWREAAGKAKP